MKRCTICKKEKALSDFRLKNKPPSFHSGQCKECEKVQRRKYYAENLIKFVEYRKKYALENSKLDDDASGEFIQTFT